MNIAERVESAIGGLTPVYHAGVDLGDDAPENYVVYEITERGGEYGEGAAHSAAYIVTLHIMSPAPDFGQYEFIKAAMQAAGFSYYSGGDADMGGIFPDECHWYQDYGG